MAQHRRRSSLPPGLVAGLILTVLILVAIVWASSR